MVIWYNINRLLLIVLSIVNVTLCFSLIKMVLVRRFLGIRRSKVKIFFTICTPSLEQNVCTNKHYVVWIYIMCCKIVYICIFTWLYCTEQYIYTLLGRVERECVAVSQNVYDPYTIIWFSHVKPMSMSFGLTIPKLLPDFFEINGGPS